MKETSLNLQPRYGHTVVKDCTMTCDFFELHVQAQLEECLRCNFIVQVGQRMVEERCKKTVHGMIGDDTHVKLP